MLESFTVWIEQWFQVEVNELQLQVVSKTKPRGFNMARNDIDQDQNCGLNHDNIPDNNGKTKTLLIFVKPGILISVRRYSCHLHYIYVISNYYFYWNNVPKLSKYLGIQKRVKLCNQLTFQLFFSLTLLLGVLGNTMILWAVLGFREMKSPTNIFLASLAAADLLLCIICLPVKVTFDWFRLG